MNFEKYQEAARTTAVYDGQGKFEGLCYAVLGLCGESGEVAEKVKKLWRDHGVLDSVTREELGKELGDVLWYLSAVSDEIGISLDEAAIRNIEKLKSRKDRDKLSGSGDNR